MLKRIVAAVALALLIAVPAQADEQDLEVRDNGQIGFVMPSGNIGCFYTPEGGTEVYEPAGGGPELICERVEPEYVTVILAVEGEPLVIEDPDEQSCCGAENVFEYGNFVELDGFYCVSATTGLTCENDEGYGFSMARAGIELYEPSDAGDGDDADDEDAD